MSPELALTSITTLAHVASPSHGRMHTLQGGDSLEITMKARVEPTHKSTSCYLPRYLIGACALILLLVLTGKDRGLRVHVLHDDGEYTHDANFSPTSMSQAP